MSIALRIQQIRQEIPPSVRLIAISKQVPVTAMREAYGAGIRDFGENRLQEALEKQELLQDLPDLRWHFIGHLQANKAQKAIANFDWIHSVDSLKLAMRLDQLAKDVPNPPQVCLQVKLLPDPNKYGWEVGELMAAIPQLESLSHLKIAGLMTILPLGLTETQQLAAFASAHDLAQSLQLRSQLNLTELSMGMSGDYSLAVQKGATMIRLGRILFSESQENKTM